MSKMPTAIARFLALPDKEGFNIYDRFAYLIKTANGDSYYLCEQLPEEGFVTEELGCRVYEAINKDITYQDIFNWYTDWK